MYGTKNRKRGKIHPQYSVYDEKMDRLFFENVLHWYFSTVNCLSPFVAKIEMRRLVLCSLAYQYSQYYCLLFYYFSLNIILNFLVYSFFYLILFLIYTSYIHPI